MWICRKHLSEYEPAGKFLRMQQALVNRIDIVPRMPDLRFWFEIHDLCESSRRNEPSRSRHGTWEPPRDRRMNQDGLGNPGNHNRSLYFFNGNSLEQWQQLPPNYYNQLQPFGQVSMYYDHDLFWCVPFDASHHHVGDGGRSRPSHRNRASSEDENTPTYDWSQISFVHDTQLFSSRININGHPKLIATRDDCSWPERLLPNHYHPVGCYRGVPNQSPPFGSLYGNLGMLICLIGFSADGNNNEGVTQALGGCIRGTQWRAPAYDRRHRGCTSC